MKLSTRTRYGLRAVVELASHKDRGTISMQRIADSQALSRKYLDTLFNSLKVAGLVVSRRGLGGGWSLTRDPAAIRLGEVAVALEGSLDLVSCVAHPETCARSEVCVTRELYEEMSAALIRVLDRYTLDDLVSRRIELEGALSLADDGVARCADPTAGST